MVVGFSRKFLSKEVDFVLTFKELMFLSDSFSLVKDDDTDIPILGGTPLFSKAYETYRSDGIPVNDNLLVKILFAISKFSDSSITQINILLNIREILQIREVAYSNLTYSGEEIGKNLLLKISSAISKNTHPPIPRLQESVVSEVEEIIQDKKLEEEG